MISVAANCVANIFLRTKLALGSQNPEQEFETETGTGTQLPVASLHRLRLGSRTLPAKDTSTYLPATAWPHIAKPRILLPAAFYRHGHPSPQLVIRE